MRILLANDDGIMAPGLLAMHAQLSTRGQVTVVAPTTPQSAVGHAISVSQPLFCQETEIADGIRGYSVDGRPADCVKLALLELMKDAPPDLVVAGLNHGANVGINMLYSGTVAAAIEGAFYGVPSLATSLAHSKSMDFRTAARLACGIIDQIVEAGRLEGLLINLNVPDLSVGPAKGIRVCHMTIPPSQEEMIRRTDPRGRPYFWITGGEVPVGEPDPESDQMALAEGYITLTPLQFDLTDTSRLKAVADWGLKLRS